jgi:hypothetical protein
MSIIVALVPKGAFVLSILSVEIGTYDGWETAVWIHVKGFCWVCVIGCATGFWIVEDREIWKQDEKWGFIYGKSAAEEILIVVIGMLTLIIFTGEVEYKPSVFDQHFSSASIFFDRVDLHLWY